MKILGQIAFLLLLGGIWCQNNRNAKAGGKSTKRSGGNQGGDGGQSPPTVELTPGSTGGSGSTRGTAGGTAEAGREGAAGARAPGQQTDDMRLHFLKNTQVTCNDGTAAGCDFLIFSLPCFPETDWDGKLDGQICLLMNTVISVASLSILMSTQGWFPLTISSILFVCGSAGFTSRSSEEAADGCYFWKVSFFQNPTG